MGNGNIGVNVLAEQNKYQKKLSTALKLKKIHNSLYLCHPTLVFQNEFTTGYPTAVAKTIGTLNPYFVSFERCRVSNVYKKMINKKVNVHALQVSG